MTRLADNDEGETADGRRVAATAALATTGAALAAAACCVLPIAFPAIALAGAGVALSVFGLAYRVLAVGGGAAVLVAWAWVALQSRRTRRRPAPQTLRWLTVATLMAVAVAAWPLVEPGVLRLVR